MAGYDHRRSCGPRSTSATRRRIRRSRATSGRSVRQALRREIPARIQPTPGRHPQCAATGGGVGFDLIDGAANAKSQLAQLAARKVPVILGQVVSNEEIPDKSDYPAVDETLPATLTNAGVTTAIATFSRAVGSLAPSGSSKWLLLDAGIAAGYGMTEQQVLQAVTIIPARILGVQDRVGSLTVGKDADVIVLDGPPLSMKSWVERVYVGGELVHEKR
jgi:imidazolonepropionase-like amidohydrolase